MKKTILKFLIWVFVFNFGILGALGASMSSAKAADPDPTPDSKPEVQFTNISDTGTVLTSDFQIPVEISPTSDTATTINYTISGEASTDSQNYTVIDNNNGTIIIPENTSSADINININRASDTCKKNEVLLVDLTDVSDNATRGDKVLYTIYLDNDCPLTSFSTQPNTPDGNNNWFITKPEIFLDLSDPNVNVETFYQWNIDSGAWSTYSDAIPLYAEEGDNILYYYSALGDIIEREQNHEIKVDTIRPLGPDSVSVEIGSDGYVHLAWSAVADAYTYTISRVDFGDITTLSSDNLSLIDQNIKNGQTYNYKIIVTDEAGNPSDPVSVSITVPVKQIIQQVTQTTTTVFTPKSISSGISTQNEEVITEAPKEVSGESDTNDNNSNTGTDETNNWSQLLLALSILIIAAGAAIGGYYGYAWWAERGNDENDKTPPKSKSRW
jgi:hypothetical protein